MWHMRQELKLRSTGIFTRSYLWRPQVAETLTLYVHKTAFTLAYKTL